MLSISSLKATMDRIMKSLPTISQTAAPLAANYTLSQYFEGQVYIVVAFFIELNNLKGRFSEICFNIKCFMCC